MMRSEANFEFLKISGCGPDDFGSVGDIAAHLLLQFDEKTVDFVGIAFNDELHASVGQIADEAGYVETRGNRARGVAEADALHAAGED